MTELAALVPPAPPQASAVNVMQFQLERRSAASAAVAAVRQAAGEDPRSALRLAHAERDAAGADIGRLGDVLARARQHLETTTARLRAAEAAALHVDTAAAEGLIAALTANATPAIALEDGEAAKAARLSRESEIASAAVDQLGAELADAEERSRVATWRVRALALAALEAHGVEIAEAMLAEQQDMRQRRAHLSALQTLLTNEWRATCGDAVSPPATISAAVSALDPPPAWKPSSPLAPRQATAPNSWSGLFQALIADAEAKIEAAA
jgi:hypothetical protein